jgi:hypothetical protein
MWNPFEQPYAGLISAALLLPILFLWRRSWRLAVLAAALAAAAAFALDFLAATDREKVKSVIAGAADAFESESLADLESLISDDYGDSLHPTKGALLRRCGFYLSEPLVERGVVRMREMTLRDSAAAVVFTARIVFEQDSLAAEGFKRIVFLKMGAGLRRCADGRWRISTIELLELDRQPVRWDDLSRAVLDFSF